MNDETSKDEPTQEATRWEGDGWTARVIKNIDDDGWAVEMTLDGEPEPALTGPWTMGRDKKNPKPLDANAFSTLVKTASEVLMRHQQHQHAMLHKSVTVTARGPAVALPPGGFLDGLVLAGFVVHCGPGNGAKRAW